MIMEALTTTPEADNQASSAPSNASASATAARSLEFGLLMNRTMGAASTSRPSDKSANDVQVDIMLGQAGALSKMNDQYTHTYVVKGTKALYDLLGAIYGYALQIDGSPLRDHVLQRMRDELQSKYELKTQANTPWITTVIRFILPTDRQTAASYARVLQVAFDENLTAKELPDYIRERGGISKISTTKEGAESIKAIKDHNSKKLVLAKKVLLATAKAATMAAPVADDNFLSIVPEGKKQGEFDLAIGVQVGSEVKIIRFLHISEEMESTILSAIAQSALPDDLTSLQTQLDDYREQLGITNGWGMKPGDKGYELPNVPAIPSSDDQAALESASAAQPSDTVAS
jgi:hypothetical protein